MLLKAKIDTDTDTEVFCQISTESDQTLKCQYRNSTIHNVRKAVNYGDHTWKNTPEGFD